MGLTKPEQHQLVKSIVLPGTRTAWAERIREQGLQSPTQPQGAQTAAEPSTHRRVGPWHMRDLPSGLIQPQSW